MDVPVVDVPVVAAEHVRHRGGRGGQRGRAERQVEHGPQVLLELRGPRPLDGPVPAVVRAHRELVDQQPGVGLEELDRQQAGHPELGREPQREFFRLRRPAGGQPGRGRDDLAADAVALDRLHHRVHRALAVRRAGRERGELTGERDVLLGQERGRSPVGWPVGWRPAQRQHLGGLRRGLAHPHALAVVAAADRFQHHRPGTPGELLDVGEAGDRREARAGDAEPGQPLPHHQLVLGQPQRRGARPDGHARLLERGQVIAGHMLVVEGEHVASGRERAQVIERAVVAYLRCGPDLGGAVVGRVSQDAEADTEADSGLGGHPGQLAGAHHAHHGSARRQATRRGIGHGPYPNRPAARR